MPSLKVNISLDATQTVTVINTVGGLTGGLTISTPLGRRYDMFSPHTALKDTGTTAGGLSDIKIHDDKGRLDVTFEHGRCYPSRNTTGDVEIRYRVISTQTHHSKDARGCIVKSDHELIAPGSAFLPLLPDGSIFDVHLTLDPGQQGSSPWHGHSTIGNGLSLTSRATSKEMQQAIFMFGDQTKSIPGTPGRVGTYYLGDLPDNLRSAAQFCEKLFPYLVKHFKDETGSLSLYFRVVPEQVLRGVLLGDAILLDYGEGSAAETEWELTRYLTRCMVARWARLDDEEHGSDNEWFTLGISYLYSIYFPFRFRFQTPDYFRATLNGYLTSYFTNPLVKVPLTDLPSASTAWHAHSAKAMRACLYMIRMDSLTRRASLKMEAGIERPIDEIVAAISVRRQEGETVREGDWLGYVGDWIGRDLAEKHLRDMKSGVVLDLEETNSAFGGSLVVESQKVMQMGFDVQSLSDGVVSGVEAGSNAEVVGLRNGDEIKCRVRQQLAEEQYEDMYKVRVVQKGQEREVEWWPRGEEEVRSWQSRKKVL